MQIGGPIQNGLCVVEAFQKYFATRANHGFLEPQDWNLIAASLSSSFDWFPVLYKETG